VDVKLIRHQGQIVLDRDLFMSISRPTYRYSIRFFQEKNLYFYKKSAETAPYLFIL